MVNIQKKKECVTLNSFFRQLLTPLLSCFDEAKELAFLTEASHAEMSSPCSWLEHLAVWGMSVQLCVWYTSSSWGCRDRCGGAGEEVVAALQPVVANCCLVLPNLSGSKGCVTSRPYSESEETSYSSGVHRFWVLCKCVCVVAGRWFSPKPGRRQECWRIAFPTHNKGKGIASWGTSYLNSAAV